MATNPELEHAIETNPDDKQAYSVYADWLQTQNDPRGELIALSLAGNEAAVGGLLLKKGGDLLGPLVDQQKSHDGNATENFTWRWGFIDRARLSYDENMFEGEVDLVQVLRDLLEHPAGRFIRELVFAFNGETAESNLDDLINVIAEKPRPTLRSLFFGDIKYAGAAREQDQGEDTEISWYSVGNLTELWPQVSNLEKLIITSGGGDTTLGELDLPKLKHLEYRSGGLPRTNFEAILRSTTPELEYLDVWTGQDNYGGTTTVEDLRALLGRKDLPKLKHLGIMNCEQIEELVPDLKTSELVAKLDELDLSMGCLSDEGATALAADPGALSSLKKLDVSYNLLTEV
ncbi:MAG TPA: TIGR02996 domain-containing protein, partial [Kofleriaceae bacterium]